MADEFEQCQEAIDSICIEVNVASGKKATGLVWTWCGISQLPIRASSPAHDIAGVRFVGAWRMQDCFGMELVSAKLAQSRCLHTLARYATAH